MLLIVFGIILFVLLVVVHEWGHFISARRNGVDVEEFGIGFPPKAKTLTRKNGTEYTLNWLPLGGFVRLKGEYYSAKGKGTFGAAPFKKKALIIFAGIAMNWIAAAAIFTVVAFFGMPQVIDDQFKVSGDATITRQEVIIGQVAKDSPAERAELQQLDVIKSVGTARVSTIEQLVEATSSQAGDTVDVVYVRSGEERSVSVTLNEDVDSGALGIGPASNTLVRSTWSAPIVGVGTTVQLTIETYKGIFSAVGNLFTGNGSKASESVSGPVGIFVTLKTLASQGLVFVLFLIGVLSVSLAVFNSLPIPALDGGRLFVMALFKGLKKPLGKDLEERIHGMGMMFLLLLVLLVTILDVKRL